MRRLIQAGTYMLGLLYTSVKLSPDTPLTHQMFVSKLQL